MTSVNPVNPPKDKSQVTINSPAKTSLKAPLPAQATTRINKLPGGNLTGSISNATSGFSGRSMPTVSRSAAPDRTPKTVALNINSWHKAAAPVLNKKV